jgi:adsorption protein B
MSLNPREIFARRRLLQSVATSFALVWSAVDNFVAACLLPTALAILASGLDDLILDAICAWAWLYRKCFRAPEQDPLTQNEKAIAIFVPLWHEYSVIRGMVEHNVAAIDYDNYHFFIGAYPNDQPTLDAVSDLEARFPHVHLAVCPHDGPTSKADCLNWIYQRMLLFEEHNSMQFDLVVTHDAEDLIHPGAFEQINAQAGRFAMIQIPVLPLPTPFRNFVHGIYCDEFAEWQLKDMRARQIMGSFIPSNGVGTGFTRQSLEKLATAEHNLIFEPGCLTEDYENGLRLHKLGCAQVFVPLSPSSCGMIATREFFPLNMRSAIRQRTRWIMGICLQSWERHGWRGSPAEVYWFWRDRKGLLGNPLSLVTNLLFVYGLLTWLGARITGSPWNLEQHSLPINVLRVTMAVQVVQTSIRMACSGRIYGAVFALGVPLRAICANWINTVATFRAVAGYLRARIRHEPLVWLKTEHAYPSRSALTEHKRKLGEILVGSGYLDADVLSQALAHQSTGLRIGEYLVKLGKISQEDLYEALSLQQSLPAGRLEPLDISTGIARALPRHVVRDWRVLPFRIAAGSMFLASPDIPTDELSRTVGRFTRLALRFHLVTPANFQELADSLL